MTIKTSSVCVVGRGIRHSRSPMIYGYWIKQHDLNAEYTICDMEETELADLIASIRAGEKTGCNITVPYKQEVIQYLDKLDPAAILTGSVNTIYLKNGLVCGTSTDGQGYVSHLKQTYPSFTANNSTILILGAGGAARSIAVALVDAGCTQILVSNRTIEKARDMEKLQPAAISAIEWSQINQAAGKADLVINTTSLGMTGKPALQFSVSDTKASCIISDIVYSPLETQLLADAHTHGRPTLDGLGMLLHQAVPGFRLWFGKTPRVTPELRDLVEQDLLVDG